MAPDRALKRNPDRLVTDRGIHASAKSHAQGTL